MNKKISNIAVLGSGIMGSGIACHFANIGVEVLLLDICPKELNESEKKKNLSLVCHTKWIQEREYKNGCFCHWGKQKRNHKCKSL